MDALAPSTHLAIVVGIVPEAELHDRATGYALAGALEEWIRRAPGLAAPTGVAVCEPLVISDVWALSDPSVSRGPRIAVGGPRVNAMTASLVESLPRVLTVDREYQVQIDVERADPVAACWGVDAAGTRAAVEAFVGRYLDLFMDGAYGAGRR